MTRRKTRALALLLTAALGACDRGPEPLGAVDSSVTPAAGGVSAATGPNKVMLGQARVQLPVVAGRPGAAYLTVVPPAGPPRTITGVEVAGAGRAEIHASRNEAGVMRMTWREQVKLEPGQTLRFAPGGDHIMLFDLDPKLKPGRGTQLTVTFDNGDKATTSATVVAAGAAAKPDGRERAH